MAAKGEGREGAPHSPPAPACPSPRRGRSPADHAHASTCAAVYVSTAPNHLTSKRIAELQLRETSAGPKSGSLDTVVALFCAVWTALATVASAERGRKALNIPPKATPMAVRVNLSEGTC